MTQNDVVHPAAGTAPSAPPPRPVRRWALALSVGTGRLVSVVGPVVIVALMGGWLFVTDLDERYAFVMICIGALALLAALVMLCSLAAGKVWLSDVYAHPLHRAGREGEPQPGGVPPLPLRLPGGGFSRWRRIAYCVCVVTVAVGWIGLAAGGREVSPEVEWIDHDGSAVVHSVTIKSLRDLEFREEGSGHYSSRITVTVPTRWGDQDADVDITGDRKPQVGERVTVLYSMESVGRGVLVGDAEELLAELEGESFTTAGRWVFLGFWAAGVAAGLALLHHDSRPGRRLRRIGPGQLALRGTVVGGRVWSTNAAKRPTFGTPNCLTLETENGTAGFVVDSLGGQSLAEALGRAAVWLVWNPADSTRHFAPAVLVGDEGWCLHGRLSMDAPALAAAGARDAGPLADASRSVRYPDLREAWPARTTRGVVVLAVLGLFFGLLMVQSGDWDMDGGQRWMVAVFAVLFTWSLSALYLDATKLGRPEKGKGARKPAPPDKDRAAATH